MADVTSATGGTLLPAAEPAPVEDLDLDKVIQERVAAITGIAGDLVRPRWQPVAPKQPEPDADWCAVAVVDSEADAGPYLQHHGGDPGATTSIRHETFYALTSFYGPHAKALAGVLRDGLGVPQNLEPLAAADISYISCGKARAVPELVNQQWVRRWDLLLQFARKVTREYAIQNILAADVHLVDDGHVDATIRVPPPSP